MVHVSEPPTAPAAPEMHVVWVTALPCVPKVRLHNPVLAYENGDEFLAILRRAAEGRLDPFILVFEGSVPDEKLSGEGYWAAFGDDPQAGQPMSQHRCRASAPRGAPSGRRGNGVGSSRRPPRRACGSWSSTTRRTPAS